MTPRFSRARGYAAAMFVADRFERRRVGMPAQVVHVVDAYAAFEGQVPSLGQHPRVANRGLCPSSSRCSSTAVADLVLGEGRVQPQNSPTCGSKRQRPADRRSGDVGPQALRRNRIPVARNIYRPLLRHGDIDARIERSRRPAQRIDTHGGILGRCRVRRKTHSSKINSFHLRRVKSVEVVVGCSSVLLSRWHRSPG